MEKVDSDKVIYWTDGVSESTVYVGGLNDLVNITQELPWRKREPNERTREYIPSEITLAEIYEYVKKNIPERVLITVFVNEPLKAPVYQCNNYTVGEWWKIGVLSGYA